jgi:putative serine protease PepD
MLPPTRVSDFLPVVPRGRPACLPGHCCRQAKSLVPMSASFVVCQSTCVLLPDEVRWVEPGTRSATPSNDPSPWPPRSPDDRRPRRARRPGKGTTAVAVAALLGGIVASGLTLATTALIRERQADSIGPDRSGTTSDSMRATGHDAVHRAASIALPSVVEIYAQGPRDSGSGSGVILTRDGQILTSYHVVRPGNDGGRLAVKFYDGSTSSASIIGFDRTTDLATLQVETSHRAEPAVIGDSDALRIGQSVVALGAPFNLENTVTAGIVSALDRPVRLAGPGGKGPDTVFPAVQTDAAINPGNSGGPLVDLDGRVVALNSAIRTSAVSGVAGGSIGLGFAFPITDALPIVEQLRNGERATHAHLTAATKDAVDGLGLPAGAVVVSVESGGAAASAGLVRGDIIGAVNDEPTVSSDALHSRLRSYRPGDEVTLSLVSLAETERRDIDLTLESD